MPNPVRIHQAPRTPGIMGQPRPIPGENVGWHWAASALVGNGSSTTGYNPTAITHGIANAWTLTYWYRSNTAGQAGTETLFAFQHSIANDNNQILLQILGAVGSDPLEILHRDSAGNIIKQYRYNSQTSTSTVMAMFTFTWDGTSLLYYRNGLLTTADNVQADNSGTMTDTARAVGIFSHIDGSVPHNGNTACVAMWNTALSQTEIRSVWATGLGSNANLNVNFDEYTSCDSLVHWWRPGATVEEVTSQAGKDWADGTSAVPMNAMTTTSFDISSYAYTGSMPRGIQPATASLTTNEYFANSTQQTLGLTNVMTWACWYRWTAANNTLCTLFDIGPASGNANRVLVQLGNNQTTDEIQIYIYDSSESIIKNYEWNFYDHSVNGAVQLGSVFLVFIWDGPNNTLRCYRNGIDLGTPSSTPTDVASSARTDTAMGVFIGATKAAGNIITSNFNYLACWNRILTPSEIKLLWNEGYPYVDISKNTLGYYAADNLKHWWRLTRGAGTVYSAGGNVSTDYVRSAGVSVDANSVNVTQDADVLVSSLAQPVGHCVELRGGMIAPSSTIGIGNEWSILTCTRNLSLLGNQTLLNIANTSDNANKILISFVDAGTDYFDVFIYDSGGTLIKNYRWNTPLSTSIFTHWLFTWNGTTLTAYKTGVAVAPNTTVTNNSGTMTDTARVLRLGQLEGGLEPVTTLAARASVLAIWDTALTANEVRTVVASNVGNLMDLRKNQGAYVSADSLVHWYKLGASAEDIGRDFQGTLHLSTKVDMSDPTLHAHQNLPNFS